MKWLEVIKLQATADCSTLLDAVVQSGLTNMKAYRHAVLKDDFCVILYWDSEQVEKNGSMPGLRLVQSLREFGLIDHSIWIGEWR